VSRNCSSKMAMSQYVYDHYQTITSRKFMAIEAWWDQVIIITCISNQFIRIILILCLTNYGKYLGFLFYGIKFWDIMHLTQSTQYLQHLYLDSLVQYPNILDWQRSGIIIHLLLIYMRIFWVSNRLPILRLLFTLNFFLFYFRPSWYCRN